MCSSRRFTVAVGRSCPRRIVLGRIVVPLIVVSGLAGAPSLTEAANIYWDGLGTTWNSTTDWSTASNATTPHPAAVPGGADVANFNISTVNTAQTVNLDAAQSALGLDFTSTGAVTINTGTGTNAITIGLGGITIAAGSGADAINANVVLGIAETWTNNSANALTVAGSITNGSNTLTIGGSGITNLNGVLGSGSGGLTMSGTGTLNLGPTTYTGATTVSSGTLFLNSSSGFGQSSGVSIAAGATVDLDGIAGSTNISIAGAGIGGNGALVSSFPFIPGVWSGNVTLAGDTTVGGTGDIPLSGAVTGNGHTLTKVGNNTLTLSGSTDNSNLGVVVNAGTVVLAKSSAASVHAIGVNGLTINAGAVQLGGTGGDQINDGAAVEVNGGTFSMNGRSETIAALDSIGSTGIVQNASATAAALTLNLANSNFYAGVLQDGAGGGALSLIIGGNGAGSEDLTGKNAFTGGLTINSGQLFIGSAGALNVNQPNAVAFGVNSTGTLAISVHNVVISGLTTNATVGTPVVESFSGVPVTLTVSNASPNTFAGVLQDGLGSLPLGLTVSGSSTLTLSGANTYSGPTTIDSGVLQGGAANTFSISSAVVLGGGTLNLGGFAQSIGSLASTAGGVVTTTGTTGFDTLTVGSDNTSTTFSGSITDAAGGRMLALTKVGTGTLTLSGNITSTGPINVIGGTLALGGGSLVANVTDAANFAYSAGAFKGRLIVTGGTLTINAPFTAGNGLENDGGLTIGPGPAITLSGAGLDNEGTLTMAGGTLNLSTSAMAANVNRGTVNLSATVPFNLNGATLTNGGALNLDGGTVSGSGLLSNGPGGVVSGPGAITGPFSNAGGLLAVTDNNVNIAQAFANSGDIQLSSGAAGIASLVGAAITNANMIQGAGSIGNAITNNGTIQPLGGTLFVNGTISNTATGLLTAGMGNQLLVTAGLATNSGIINLTGGTFDNGGHPLNNAASGQISGWGIFRTGGTGLDNNGSITFSGGTTTVNGPVTNENGKTIVVAYNPAIFTGLVTNNGGGTFNIISTTAVFAGGSSGSFSGTFTNNASSAFSVGGSGVLEVDGAPTLGAASSMAVGGTSTLRFNPTTGAATVGAGVTATVASGATLELAGSVSSLSSPSTGSGQAGANRVNITNNSSSPGILASGTNQQVGNIDGAGTTQVNAGSDLTANHIVQSALVIGGATGIPGMVTIDASDANGNPLGQSSGLAVSSSLTSTGPFGASGIRPVVLSGAAADSTDLTVTAASNSVGNGNASQVPEPATLLLALLALLGVMSMQFVRRHFRCQTV
jgi:fibronectin-binding autotransporter adhesin